MQRLPRIRIPLLLLWSVLLHAQTANSASYYVDPINGSAGGTGSSSQPWKTLQEVFSSGKTFSGGDIIYLRNGNHGFPVITQNNSSNVTIKAQSGHSPIINRLDFNGASRWVIQNVAIHTAAAPPEAPVLEHPVYPKYGNSLVRITGGSAHISLLDCDVYSTLDSSAWTANDWNYKAWNGIFINNGSNHITVDRCGVWNSNFAIQITGDTHNLTVRNSTIQNYCGDGLRATGSNLLIENNAILDSYDTNGNHDDMIQGFASNNVVIRGNIIMNTTSNRPMISNAQGIGGFSGWFDDWVVENNVVVTRHWHGISLYGARNSRFVNNTVVFNPIGSGGNAPWIRFDVHDNGTAGSNNVCRNNLTSTLSTMSGATVSNNLVTTAYTDHFVNYGAHDFRLKSTSSAINAGTASQAPSTDIDGKARGLPYDIGAYEYSLFSDNFDDGNAEGWTTSGGSWSVVSSTNPLNWHYRNTGAGLSTAGSTAWTNYSVRAMVRPEASTYSCIIGRFQNNNNFYQLEIGSNQLSLWKRVNGSYTKIAFYNTTINPNTWYALRLEMNGTSIKGYLNDIQRISVIDSTFSSGKLGVRSGNDTRFDDIAAYAF